MGQTNSKRVSHTLEELPNTFRDDTLKRILNDIDEEMAGKGYSEVEYLVATPFVTKITTWETAAKLKKRTEVNFTYSPLPFVSQIVKDYYDDETGTTIISTITADVVYNPNKTVDTITSTITRP